MTNSIISLVEISTFVTKRPTLLFYYAVVITTGTVSNLAMYPRKHISVDVGLISAATSMRDRPGRYYGSFDSEIILELCLCTDGNFVNVDAFELNLHSESR